MTDETKVISAAKRLVHLLDDLIDNKSDAMTLRDNLVLLLSTYNKNISEKKDTSSTVEQILDLIHSNPSIKNWFKQYREPPRSQSATRGGVAYESSAEPIDDIPRSSATRGDTEESPHIYPVWFGTNREPVDIDDLSQGFSGDRASNREAVYYGRCDVVIPKTHRFGETGRPWWHRWATLDFHGDDHLTINKIHAAKDADHFWQVLNHEYLKNEISEREAVVFLHGFNNSFEDAALRAAQVGFDLKVRGHTAFFSWPSKAKTFKYATDEGSIAASETAITNFLINFVQKSGAERVHLIAHSMGNRGLLEALKNIVHKVKETGSEIKFGQIILAAPDLDVEVFRQAKDAYTSLSDSTTLYTSSTDIPVAISKRLHEYPRLGIVPPITVEDGIDTIKVNNFNLFNLGHGYFAEAEALLHDMFDLLRYGESPDNRQRPRLKTTDNGESYWLIDTR